jgi:hypothetical protein
MSGGRASYLPGTSAPAAWIAKLTLHGLVVAGTALAAIGAANFARPPGPGNSYSDDLHLLEAGYVLLLLALLALVAIAAVAAVALARRRGAGGDGDDGRGPGTLVRWALGALGFVACRVVYGFVYAFGHYPKLSPIDGVFAVKLVLIFLVQLLAVLCLVAGGMMFRPGKAIPADV